MTTPLGNIDWELFQQQKQVLVEAINEALRTRDESADYLEGILTFMDTVQDAWEPEKDIKWFSLDTSGTIKYIGLFKSFNDVASSKLGEEAVWIIDEKEAQKWLKQLQEAL